MRCPRSNSLPYRAAVAALAALSGCHARELGANISANQAAHVDATWLTAARACWPKLINESNRTVDATLADPIGFRGTFAAYAAYSDAELLKIAAAPVMVAPAPDNSFLRNSNTKLLTRREATGTQAPGLANAPDPRDAAEVPAEALCAIRPGTPVGFR